MLAADLLKLAGSSIRAHRTRSVLTGLGIAVGIAAVVVLTSIGEGVHRFVLAEFTQFGTNLIVVTPGKTTTHGMSGAIISNVRPLALDDAWALKRIAGVEAVVPVLSGNALVEGGSRSRRSLVIGAGPAVPDVWQMKVGLGRFLPDDDPGAARAFAVLGATMYKELFPKGDSLGQRIRIGGDRYRVIGVMQPKGQLLGFDLDDTVYIPAGRALSMFNRESLMEINILYSRSADADQIAVDVSEMLEARHGREDFTITTQDQMLKVLGSVLNILTMAVGALGGISLLVGGVGILTIMTIAVHERRAEVGLLRAIGAGRGQILVLFLGEATFLAGLGGFAGLALGIGGAWTLGALVPALPIHVSWGYPAMAELLATFIGLAAGVLPARNASLLDPVEALHAE